MKDFTPYKEALVLKELGFEEPCLGNFADDENHTLFTNGNRPGKTNAPTYSQAFRFFREKYKLQPSVNSFCFEEYSFNIMGNRNEILYPIQHKLLNDGKKNPWEFDTYEEAELACVRKLIEIVKQKQP
jgi:hypothetical protein